ncbi:hypothetical protein CGRA01v4_14396 [Colletotrichum graminicola]|nr:hypothetical protein CGRA01v4_14396 [Colletotrichum graminicola]
MFGYAPSGLALCLCMVEPWNRPIIVCIPWHRRPSQSIMLFFPPTVRRGFKGRSWLSVDFLVSSICLVPHASGVTGERVLTATPAMGVTMSIVERLCTESRRAQARSRQ